MLKLLVYQCRTCLKRLTLQLEPVSTGFPCISHETHDISLDKRDGAHLFWLQLLRNDTKYSATLLMDLCNIRAHTHKTSATSNIHASSNNLCNVRALTKRSWYYKCKSRNRSVVSRDENQKMLRRAQPRSKP
jgi:hypothetical protein